MAANIEHIFQDFILNKIKEIEEQKEEHTAVVVESLPETCPQKSSSPEKADKRPRSSSPHKKHKKSKKHKSKKKKKSKGKERDSSDSEDSSGKRRQDRSKEERSSKEKERTSSRHDRRKRRRKRRSQDRGASDSGDEDRKDQSNGPSPQLPDIVPKQESTSKSSRKSSHRKTRSRTRSRSRSRSSALRTTTGDHRKARTRSRTRSRSRSRFRSVEKKPLSSDGPVPAQASPAGPASAQATPMFAPVFTPLATPQDLAPVLPQDLAQFPPTVTAQVSPVVTAQDTPQDTATVMTAATANTTSEVTATDTPQDTPRDMPQDTPQDTPVVIAQDMPQDKAVVTAQVPTEEHTEQDLATGRPDPEPIPSETTEKTAEKTQETLKTEGKSKSQSASVKSKSDTKSKSSRTTSAASPSKHRRTSRSPHKKREHKASRRARSKSRSKSRSPGRRSPGCRSPGRRSPGRRSPGRRSLGRRSPGRRSPSRRRRSRSRSARRKRSRSRSRARRSRRSRSHSASKEQRQRNPYSQRDRWRREPSRSPILILRKNRTSPSGRERGGSSSPHRISDLDKGQLLEIAKANAAAMCVKAGMAVPSSLRSTAAPMGLPVALNPAMASMTAASMTATLSLLPSLNCPPSSGAGSLSSALEEVKKTVQKQANIISIKEFTEKCKMIVDSKGELPVAAPHVSDEEDEAKPFGAAALKELKAIRFSLTSVPVRPAARSDAGIAKEFPVSSGSQHRKKEGEGPSAYGEWVPVEKGGEKNTANNKKSSAPSKSSTDAAAKAEPEPEPKSAAESDSVFPEPPLQPVDISQAVGERLKAQKRLAENPYDVSAMCMLNRAQEQVDAWAQSNTVPGLFTGSTGAQVLSSEELSSNGPQAWLKKDQFLRAAPVSGGVGEFLMRKMGWRTGEGLGRNREGTVEPIIIDFKVDRKGLVAEGEKPQKQTGGLVVTKDLMGKHPVSALIELCTKKKIMQPDFVMVHHSGPDHRKNFLFKVTVGGVDYQPQTASPNKKHAKAMAATVALQALGEVPADGPGLYAGPVFTAASTGPLFST